MTGPEAGPPEDDSFDGAPRVPPADDSGGFLVRLDGYEGPLDVLLDLARRQKVDLRQISILALVEQYLTFIAEAKARDLELAADYLVMASWLTFLKSKLLLPAPEKGSNEPSADELSRRLAFQLERLDAMRKAAETLTSLPQLGSDVFARGVDDRRTETETTYTAALFDLLRAYSAQRVRTVAPDSTVREQVAPVFSLEDARRRLEKIVGRIPDWCLLVSLTDKPQEGVPTRSVVASNFAAALEWAKAGKVELRQTEAFSPLYIRSPGDEERSDDSE